MKNTAEQITYSAMASQMPAPKRGWNVRATNGGADLGYILPNGVSEKTARQLAADLTSGRKTWDGRKIR